MYCNKKQNMRHIRIMRSITKRDTKGFEKYLTKIGNIPLLSEEEELKVAQEARQGDKKAMDLLVTSNLLFVVSVAKQYQNQGVPISDLVNEGNLGLAKAATRFDETKGFKFISYAVWWIRQSIQMAIAEHSRLIRVPLNKLGQMNKIYQFQGEFEQEYYRIPTDIEICDKFGITEEDFIHARPLYERDTASLDRPFSEDEDSRTFIDIFPDNTTDLPDITLEKQEQGKILLSKIGNVLKDREVEVLQKFYGLDGCVPQNLYSIAEEYNLSKERVRQIRDKALKKLKRALT
jgi:RNA polymerase primary sigma factor